MTATPSFVERFRESLAGEGGPSTGDKVVVALSGGYSREEANARLTRNNGMIASFSRALSEGLNAKQSEDEFDSMLDSSIQSICDASKT